MRFIRTSAATILISVGAFVLSLGFGARWLHSTVTDTDKYVAFSSSVVEHDPVQKALVGRLGDSIMTRLQQQNFMASLERDLIDRGVNPSVAQNLVDAGGRLEPRLEGQIKKQLANIIDTEQFTAAWQRTNRALHTSLLNYVQGNTDTVTGSADGALVVHLDIALGDIRLPDQLGQLLPPLELNQTTFTLADRQELRTVKKAYSAVDFAATWFIWFGGAAIVIGLVLAPRKIIALIVTLAVVGISITVLSVVQDRAPEFLLGTLTTITS